MGECNSVRRALQELLTECMGRLPLTRDTKATKIQDPRKAVVDHVSDTFLGAGGPWRPWWLRPVKGGRREVGELSHLLREHSSKLVEVVGLACSMSSSMVGVKLASRQGLS